MEKMKYRISSRATILLGRESVSKVEGALIEIIKNTYDADASLCFVCFDIEGDTIYILDNGVGMTKEIIENTWMMIGTDNKRQNYKSQKNRIRSGEKGIGRFALDRLGSTCEMYTKNKSSKKVIYWKNDWEKFEEIGKTIDEIEADFDYIDKDFEDIIPIQILEDINKLKKEKDEEIDINLETGTLLKISKLRDNWSEEGIDKILNSLGFLIPPTNRKDYLIYFKNSLLTPYTIIENELSEEFDYKLSAKFDGEKFYIELNRNEFDLEKIPKQIFEMERFKKFPFRYCDFEKQLVKHEYTIKELMKNENDQYVNLIKKIGEFKFEYTFMKLSLKDDSTETFYYKEINPKRRQWLKQHGGIKIYRDNFLVRPYGDPNSDSFDWLGIDARRAKSPAGISHPSESWKVRNLQSQGTIFISRINNECILDKSSREGIIENDYFTLFKNVIRAIISVFEKDRAYIGRTMKIYYDQYINNKEHTKQIGKNIAKGILNENNSQISVGKNSKQSIEQVKTLARTVQYFEEEREELISEIKLLRSLATNGLITTSIVHDLKSINAILVNRVEGIKMALELNEDTLINRCLNDLEKDDTFLKSWITVIINQKKDKRTRTKNDLYHIIYNMIDILKPILNQKNIIINIQDDKKKAMKKIFVSDFESIIYNLIINSIESFEKSKIDQRIININLSYNQDFCIHYEDNGNGISEVFKDPNDIFKYGTTSKYDINGKQIGTGLGMYIISSTLREYNASYNLERYKDGFALNLKFPI